MIIIWPIGQVQKVIHYYCDRRHHPYLRCIFCKVIVRFTGINLLYLVLPGTRMSSRSHKLGKAMIPSIISVLDSIDSIVQS